MADLLDELGGQSSERIGGNVRRIGGDLLDEAGIKSNNYEMLSKRLTEKQATEDHTKLLDQINNDMSGFQKFLVGAGRGMVTVARGLGLAEPEDPVTKEAFSRLSKDSMAATAGEIIGESAPFLAAAPLAGAGLTTSAGKALIPAAKNLAGKVIGSTILGATQGGVLANGKGADAVETLAAAGVGGAVAGGIEAIIPVLGKLGRAVFAKLGITPKGPLLTPEGTPTPELQKALQQTGTSFDDLTKNAFAIVNKPGVDPAQATRAARFADQGIPATAGDITQDFGKQATEQRLLNQAGNEASEPLRQMKFAQSEAFKVKVNELVDNLGVPDDVGDSVKNALSGRKDLLRAEKNALYKKVADTAPEVANIPIFTDTLAATMPDKQQMRRLSRLAGSQIGAVDDLLVEFGINKSDDAVAAFTKSGGEITPLNIGNLEDFRSAINQIERADSTGAAKVVTGPLKSALDNEAELIMKSIKSGRVGSANTINDIDSIRSLIHGNNDDIFVRWSVGPEYDMKKGAASRDFNSGEVHRGLSAVPLDKDMTNADIAKYLGEYSHSRMGNALTKSKNLTINAHIYKGAIVGKDSDGYASIIPDKHLGSLSKSFVRELDDNLSLKLQLTDDIADIKKRMDKWTGDSTGLDIIKNKLAEKEKYLQNYIDNSRPLKHEGVGNDVLAILKQARQTVRTMKTEFSPESITGRLIDVKRDGVTPVIESSRVIKELIKPDGIGVENLQRTLTSLRSSGQPGQKAIKDLQAATVLHALEASLKSTSRKVNGVETVGGDQFAKALNTIGDDKLKEIFKGNEKMLSRLQNLKQTALDMSPAAAATPKGSAPVILDILNRAGSLPALAAFRDAVNFVVKAGSDERAVRRAMNAKPAYKQVITTFERDFPAIASALGVSAVVPKITEDKNE